MNQVASRAAHNSVPQAKTWAEWLTSPQDVDAILRLKRERNAIILAHNYQAPEIYHTVADIVGDSLALAREAVDTSADVIVLAGVHFMAETAKLLNPGKLVLTPDPQAGCSLASSITPDDVRELRERYPGVPVVTYVNTSAAVKAESDICCTSGNVIKVVKSLGASRVILIPDEYLARNVAAELPEIEVISWAGRCEVHDQFTAKDIDEAREAYPNVVVFAHPECPRDVVEASDFSGSTAAMAKFVEDKKPRDVLLVTECSMSDNLALSFPEVNFVKPCNLCPHMRRITLGKIRASLEQLTHPVEIDPAVAARAREAVERMLAVG